MKAFVINLDSRHDRWTDVERQSKKIGFPIFRIPAVTVENRDFKGSMVTEGVQAIWDSHVLAMRTFLKTYDPYCIIMEDDFKILSSNLEAFDIHARRMHIDFLQMGFLKTSYWERVSIRKANLSDRLLKILVFMTKHFPFGLDALRGKVLIREQLGIESGFIMGDIRPGAHCYLISRRFASACVNLNYPTAISTDGFFMAISWMRTFKMLRLKKSKVTQSKSPTSVKNRFKREF